MKTNSRPLFIMGITFLVVSLLWFFWNKNTAIGIVWLCAGILELSLGFIVRAKEKKGSRRPDGREKENE